MNKNKEKLLNNNVKDIIAHNAEKKFNILMDKFEQHIVDELCNASIKKFDIGLQDTGVVFSYGDRYNMYDAISKILDKYLDEDEYTIKYDILSVNKLLSVNQIKKHNDKFLMEVIIKINVK